MLTIHPTAHTAQHGHTNPSAKGWRDGLCASVLWEAGVLIVVFNSSSVLSVRLRSVGILPDLEGYLLFDVI